MGVGNEEQPNGNNPQRGRPGSAWGPFWLAGLYSLKCICCIVAWVPGAQLECQIHSFSLSDNAGDLLQRQTQAKNHCSSHIVD